MIRAVISRVLQKIAFITPGGYTLRPWLHKRRGVKVSKGVWIGQLVYIDEAHPGNVTIKENVGIALRTTIFAHYFFHGAKGLDTKPGNVVIEKDVFIGPHCLILPNVTIGEGSVIMAGTVVSKNVPARVLWGPPQAYAQARVTRPLAGGNYKNFLLGLRKL